MPSKILLKNLLIVGLTLGTAWAVRGQFGHEQGAAWAGGIAALAILILAQRADWHQKIFKASLAAAVGWGLGGMMSYGIVVGYTRGIDFINVYFGFISLFIIGGLYGFIGGGLFGLALSDSEKNRIDWLEVAMKLITGGIIFYFFIIFQLEWFMTPPRSELWAACAGMGLALTWHLIKSKEKAALRVAVYSGLGAGFGFAFGSFLKVLGDASGIPFNFWNVMEYTLGFCGGIGMAYGTFTSKWEQHRPSNSKLGHNVAFLMLSFIIPFVVWNESFTYKKLDRMAEKIGIEPISTPIIILLLVTILIFTIYHYRAFLSKKINFISNFTTNATTRFFNSYFLLYILFSIILTGAFLSTYRIEQYLYLVNFALVLFLMKQSLAHFEYQKNQPNKWFKILIIILIIIAFSAIIGININEVHEGMQRRFEY